MQFERDMWRPFGRSARVSALTSKALARAERVELLDPIALRAEAAAAGFAVHQAEDNQRAQRLVEQAFLQRELARRTGDPVTLASAAKTAERAVKIARYDHVRTAARMEMAAASVLTADLFADTQAADAAHSRIVAIEADVKLTVQDRIQLLGFKARLLGRQALADNDLNGAVEAAGAFDEVVDLSDQRVRDTGEGRIVAANVRLHRADMLIGFGMQMKECSLLRQAETDLAQLAIRIDRDRLPITWARCEALRGSALAAFGELNASEEEISQGAAALSAALAHLPEQHSPLDSARIAHALGLVLMSLGEACDEDRLIDEAIRHFDRALSSFEVVRELAQRPVCAYDRANAIARRAELCGDMRALIYAERAFKAELSAVNPNLDPVAWAVIQVALARVYNVQAEIAGDHGERANAMMALAEALDVFTERGMRNLADAALTGLEHLKAKS